MARFRIPARFAIVALAIAAVVALLAFGLPSAPPESGHAEGPGPGMSLAVDPASLGAGSSCTGGAKPTKCGIVTGDTFTLVVQTNDAPSVAVQGFDIEVLNGGMQYKARPGCLDEVQVTHSGGQPVPVACGPSSRR